MCYKFDSKPACFFWVGGWVERVPFLLQNVSVRRSCPYLFYLSGAGHPCVAAVSKHSQIAVSEAYLWHDLWVGVTPDSQKDRHCPVTALSSCRRGALSALRQTRPPSLKRIKLFHHVGNEKAVITPN